MNLLHQSFKLLYPQKAFPYQTKIKYTKKFRPYNAHIKLQGNLLQLHLSHHWQKISDDIKIGLIQSLLLKLFKNPKPQPETENPKPETLSFYLNLYHHFIKNLPLITPRHPPDPQLLQSFQHLNQQFFHGLIDQPNLKWHSPSRSKLGQYDFHSHTISLSSLFKNAPPHLLDYILYHELLHLKHQFQSKNNRLYYHTQKFKQEEKRYPQQKQLEKQLQLFLKNIKNKNFYKPPKKSTKLINL